LIFIEHAGEFSRRSMFEVWQSPYPFLIEFIQQHVWGKVGSVLREWVDCTELSLLSLESLFTKWRHSSLIFILFGSSCSRIVLSLQEIETIDSFSQWVAEFLTITGVCALCVRVMSPLYSSPLSTLHQFFSLTFNFFLLSLSQPQLFQDRLQLLSKTQCVKPVTFSQVSVLPKLTLLSCHLGRPESRSKACLSCSSHFDPFYGQKVPKMAINAVFWP